MRGRFIITEEPIMYNTRLQMENGLIKDSKRYIWLDLSATKAPKLSETSVAD
ncbi:hypothetical protein D3C73_1674640 [compost metagenome]